MDARPVARREGAGGGVRPGNGDRGRGARQRAFTDRVAAGPGRLHLADWYERRRSTTKAGRSWSCPTRTHQAQIERAQQLAVQAFVATDYEGMARADFFVRETDGEIVMNELNTIPGSRRRASTHRLFEASGLHIRRGSSTASSSSRSNGTSAAGKRAEMSLNPGLLPAPRPRLSSASSRAVSRDRQRGKRTRMQFPCTPALSRIRPRWKCRGDDGPAVSSGASSFEPGSRNELNRQHRAEPANIPDLRCGVSCHVVHARRGSTRSYGDGPARRGSRRRRGRAPRGRPQAPRGCR